MLETIKESLSVCPMDGAIYLVSKLSDISGFFMVQKHLVYMVNNKEAVAHQSLSTDLLRLNTNIDITAIKSNQQFSSGKYNVLEILPIEGAYDDEMLISFINLCVAHTEYMGASSFVKFFYSLVNLFQYPKEQNYINLVGLFGELSFLKYVYDTNGRDLSANWHSSGSTDKYDISLDDRNIEIKSTRSTDELITIKHPQLFNGDRNYLVTVCLEESNNGVTLNQLISEMRNNQGAFNNYSFALNIEREKKRVSPVDAETKRFIVKSTCIYAACEINPFGILPQNISELSYRMDLSEQPQIELSELI